MTTEIEPNITSRSVTRASWKPCRLTIDQLLAMIDAGIFPADAPVELLGGVLVQRMVKGDPLDNSLDALGEILRALVPVDWLVREDKSLQLTRYSRPEPDIAIVRVPRAPYYKRTPHARETALVAEVAESSYGYDRGEKWRAYAAARIQIYGIVNLEKRQVEDSTDPAEQAKSALDRQTTMFGDAAEIPVEIDGLEVGRIAVHQILP